MCRWRRRRSECLRPLSRACAGWAYLSALLQPENPIDIVRDVGLRPLADTERLLNDFSVQAFRSDSDVLHRELAPMTPDRDEPGD